MYKSIQGCRALAALLVVLHHLGSAMASGKYFGATFFSVPFIAGDSGVEFFFVLSGFIITWAHFNEIGRPADLLNYLRKRIVRIYPTYWIVFAIVYLLTLASPTLRSTVPHDYATLVKSLALLPQEQSIPGGTGTPVLSVAWSLQYEVCFYALMAIFIVSRPLGILVSIPLLVNFGACQIGACSFPRSFFSSNLILLFGLGVLIAYCSKRSIRIKRPMIVAAIAAAAFISFGAFEAVAGTETLPLDRRLIYGLLSAVVIFALVQSEGSGQLRIKNRWMPLLGDASYSLYLIHYPLISLLCKLLIFVGLAGQIGAVIAYPVILCACIFTALAFHVLVEKPILRVLAEHRSAAALVHGVP
jgi:exopolysaccharide production protein ExoZ